MSTPITRPTNLTAVDWANNVVLDLRSLALLGSLTDETQWQGWGAQLLNSSSLPGNLPNPYQFSDWKLWAERLCDALS